MEFDCKRTDSILGARPDCVAVNVGPQRSAEGADDIARRVRPVAAVVWMLA